MGDAGRSLEAQRPASLGKVSNGSITPEIETGGPQVKPLLFCTGSSPYFTPPPPKYQITRTLLLSSTKMYGPENV